MMKIDESKEEKTKQRQLTNKVVKCMFIRYVDDLCG
jgi:hypothetical protein